MRRPPPISHICIDRKRFQVYLSDVLSGRSHPLWTSLLAITLLAGSRIVSSADPVPTASSGDYKTVPIHVGGKTIPVRVQDSPDPFGNVSSSNSTGKYDPQRIFSNTSPLANKKFSMPFDSGTQGTSKFTDQEAFVTKSYVPDNSSSIPNLNSKVSFASATGYNRNATGFDKNYASSGAPADLDRTAVLGSSTTAEEQGRTAILGGSGKGEILAANNMANKQYLGPGAQHVPDGVEIPDNIVISRMSGLPNRPLSIDEVRNLINHETKPNTDVKPDEPSKPLNDPDYKPQPLRDSPAPTGDDDKTDAVPPPGTIADPQPAPENSEPLPQP